MFYSCIYTYAQVSGTVFRDYNGDGVQNSSTAYNEFGVSGILVTAYDSAGSPVGTATTDATGNYAFNGLTLPLRVEFTGLYPGDFTSTTGSTYGSSVQFVTAPSTTTNFAVNAPQDYWDASNPNNVSFMIPRYNAGAYDGVLTNGLGIGRFYKTTQGVPTNDNSIINISIDTIAKVGDVGSVWGQAFQKSQQRSFFGALGKRHAEEGIRGLDGVYIVGEIATNDYGLVGGFDLQGVIPANGGTVIDLGSITRNHIPGDDYFIGDPTATYARDLDAFAKVGKVGYGDLDYDDANKLLWLVNLAQRTLISVDVSVPTSTLNNATSATLSPLTNAYDILSLPGVPTCANGELRPWGLGFEKGMGYLGVVCDATGSRNTGDLVGYILRFDPTNVSAGFTTVLTLNLGGYHTWQPWANSWSETWDEQYYMQPIISDISFTETNDLVINIMDRWGHQAGLGQPKAITGNTDFLVSIALGDILYACYDGNGWNIEGSTASCPQVNTNTGGTNDGYGMTGLEYFEDLSGDGSSENNQGASLMLPGTEDLITIVTDPLAPGQPTGEPYWSTGGFYWYDHTTGDKFQWARVYPLEWQNGFGKANGLGDIDFLGMQPQPLEIGNRVWIDTDEDGIQDAGETPIAGVSIELYAADGTTLLGTATTAADGSWYFNNTNISGGLLPNTAYIIKVGAADWSGGTGTAELNGYTLTSANTDGTTNGDLRDNDATLLGAIPTINYTTGDYGQNDHTLDMGFRLMPPDLSLTKTVNTAIATLNGTATFTITLTNDNGIDATGVVVTDVLPAGVTFVSSSDPANVTVAGNTLTWNVGNMLGTDAPKTLDITVTAGSEGSFVNNAEITSMNETDVDSTPNNNVPSEDDQDQACFSVPVSLCSDSPTANITITSATATSYQWYVSTDNGLSYTALTGETNQVLMVDNTLMGGNNITKYFKVAYNGAPITGTCGETMCCPIIVTTQTCMVCPPPKCITIAITKH